MVSAPLTSTTLLGHGTFDSGRENFCQTGHKNSARFWCPARRTYPKAGLVAALARGSVQLLYPVPEGGHRHGQVPDDTAAPVIAP